MSQTRASKQINHTCSLINTYIVENKFLKNKDIYTFNLLPVLYLTKIVRVNRVHASLFPRYQAATFSRCTQARKAAFTFEQWNLICPRDLSYARPF